MSFFVLAHDRFVKPVNQPGSLDEFLEFFERCFLDFALYSYEE